MRTEYVVEARVDYDNRSKRTEGWFWTGHLTRWHDLLTGRLEKKKKIILPGGEWLACHCLFWYLTPNVGRLFLGAPVTAPALTSSKIWWGKSLSTEFQSVFGILIMDRRAPLIRRLFNRDGLKKAYIFAWWLRFTIKAICIYAFAVLIILLLYWDVIVGHGLSGFHLGTPCPLSSLTSFGPSKRRERVCPTYPTFACVLIIAIKYIRLNLPYVKGVKKF